MPGRKPTQLLELSGAFRKNPQRRRNPEPPSNGPLGDPPARLPVEAVPFWNELAAMCPAGVLRKSDRLAVELAARLMEKAVRELDHAAILELARTAELSPKETRRLIQREHISGSELNVLRSLLSAMGLSPVDRSRLSIPVEIPTNRFADLAKERPN